MANVQLFISAVTSEFGSYRNALRKDLDRPGVSVKVQEDFIATGTETLDKLDEYISHCNAVIHLVGDMTGSLAQAPSVQLLFARYPDLLARFPQLAEALKGDPPLISYTQWEAWLALYHRKPLIIARAHEFAPRDDQFRKDPSEQKSQAAHLAQLAASERYPETIFENPDRLSVSILRSKLYDIIATAGTIDLASVLRSKLGEKAIAALQQSPKTVERDIGKVQERIEDSLATHLTRIANWSGNIQFYRMPAPKRTDDSTIALTFSSIPRKFQTGIAQNATTLDEGTFLATEGHFVVLGQPGAGKTTTVKRLVRQLLNPSERAVLRRTPIVVRLNIFNRTGEQSGGQGAGAEPSIQGSWLSKNQVTPLLGAIATELGLRNSLMTHEEFRRFKGEALRDSFAPASSRNEPLVRVCEGEPIEALLPRVLDGLQAAVFLDGLDEVNAVLREYVERDIALLIESTKSCKFMVTCRSAEYTSAFAFLTVAEVCNLQDGEIEFLAQRWLGADSTMFMAKLKELPLVELAQRPLFLMQMLVLYANNGYLPDQPFEVYRMITLLMIREWDKDRSLQRKSKYADFESERKLDFLANLAFELTYVTGSKIFTDLELGKAFSRIRRKFNLPEDQRRQVLIEVESHTGIVAETGGDRFEFAHLTIQEYLCAYHLVRLPFPKKSIAKYLRQYPAPLAIATALSSEPIDWLAGILCDPSATEGVASKNIITFLDRLSIENPILMSGPAVGFCVVGLLFLHSQINTFDPGKGRVEAQIDALIAKQFIRLSLIEALCCYSILLQGVGDAPGQLRLKLDEGRASAVIEAMENPPIDGSVDQNWLRSRLGGEILFQGLSISRRR